jgi:hypothetical protein
LQIHAVALRFDARRAESPGAGRDTIAAIFGRRLR